MVLASLEEPLDFLADAAFDIVIAPLVMDYVCDWRAAFSEFHRALKPGGILVVSLEHPLVKYCDHQAESYYFQVERVTYTWLGFGTAVDVPSYRRPLAEVLNPLIETGFALDMVLEPLPTEAFKEKDPKDYEKLIREPGILCLRAVKK